MNVKDGTVSAGNDQYTKNDIREITIPIEGSKPPILHLHQFPDDGQIDFKYKSFNGGGSIVVSGGPSGQDRTNASGNKNGIRDVVIDAKFIYLINGNSSQDIKIPRQ